MSLRPNTHTHRHAHSHTEGEADVGLHPTQELFAIGSCLHRASGISSMVRRWLHQSHSGWNMLRSSRPTSKELTWLCVYLLLHFLWHFFIVLVFFIFVLIWEFVGGFFLSFPFLFSFFKRVWVRRKGGSWRNWKKKIMTSLYCSEQSLLNLK